MKCSDKGIKELLPAHLENALDAGEGLRVERHLESCEDCRMELGLLRMMAEETVPDPGGAFWATIPERVYREITERKRKDKRSDSSGLLRSLLFPRWAWASAGLVLIAAAAWFFYRPAALEIAKPVVQDEALFVYDDGDAGMVDVSGLNSSELNAAEKWANATIAYVADEGGWEAWTGDEKDIDEKISEMSDEDLARFMQMLESKERKSPRDRRGKIPEEKEASEVSRDVSVSTMMVG